MDDPLTIHCERHGTHEAAAVCRHHLGASGGSGRGWHMLGSGDDERPDAICFECVAAWPPELSAEEAGIEPVIVCGRCYDELRDRHDVGHQAPDA